MINWKKEGYILGENVLIVNKFGIYNQRQNLIDGVVTYVGTKVLKVSIYNNENEKILTFNGRKSCSGAVFGDYYIVYKSREEYEAQTLDKEEMEKLKVYITRSLSELDLDTLVDIKDKVDKFKNDKSKK